MCVNTHEARWKQVEKQVKVGIKTGQHSLAFLLLVYGQSVGDVALILIYKRSRWNLFTVHKTCTVFSFLFNSFLKGLLLLLLLYPIRAAVAVYSSS